MSDSWLYEAVCRRKPELWVSVGYMKLCLERDLNCGLELVTCNCVYRENRNVGKS